MIEHFDERRKRAWFRAVRRGTKESDAVIGGFAKRHLARLDEAQLVRFEALLDCPDQDLLAWVVGVEPAPEAYDNDVLALMREFERSLRR
jgi:succinate dehydrogenase flavin-adding protein (antitoxin of CptAB toxin-antitoxin module)